MAKSSGGGGMPDPSSYIPLAQEQARLNNVNTYTPYGSTIYRLVGGSPSPMNTQTVNGTESRPNGNGGRMGGPGYGNNSTSSSISPVDALINGGGQYESVTEFSPEIQNIFNQQVAAALNPDQFNQQVSDASFNHAMNLLNPQFDAQTSQFQNMMANRGLPINSEAYGTAFGDLMRSQNASREQAALQSVLQGQGAAQNAFNRMASMTGGPAGGGQAANVDIMGAAGLAQNSNMAQQQAANQKKNSGTSAAATMAAAYMLCDENIKYDKETINHNDILNKLDEIRVEKWKYINSEDQHIGPYAQDFVRAFNIGNDNSINFIDAIGILLSANKALLNRVRALENA